jgi:hypothetical protein
LQGLLTCDSKELEGDGAMNLLQERLQAKPICMEKLYVSDFPDIQSIDLESLLGKSKCSVVCNLVDGILLKLHLLKVTHSDSDNKHMNSVEGQLRTVLVAVESQCTDKSLKSFPSSNHMHQPINGYSGATHIQGNYQKCEIRDVSTCATYQQGQCVPLEVSQNAVNELETCHVELNAVKRDISLLHDSITSVGSQLLKLSVRPDFLGIDSIGRLCWALATPRGRSRIIG